MMSAELRNFDDDSLQGEENSDVAQVLKSSQKLLGEHARSLKGEIASIVDNMVAQATANQSKLIMRYHKSQLESETILRAAASEDSVDNDVAAPALGLPKPPFGSPDFIPDNSHLTVPTIGARTVFPAMQGRRGVAHEGDASSGKPSNPHSAWSEKMQPVPESSPRDRFKANSKPSPRGIANGEDGEQSCGPPNRNLAWSDQSPAPERKSLLSIMSPRGNRGSTAEQRSSLVSEPPNSHISDKSATSEQSIWQKLGRSSLPRQPIRGSNRASTTSDAATNGTKRLSKQSAGKKSPTGPVKMGTRAVFKSRDEMMTQLHAALLQPGYNVQDYYHEEGWAQAIAKSAEFEYMTMLVISFNAIWIAIEFDFSPDIGEPDVIFQIVEHLISIFFLTELAVRYFAFRETHYAFRDRWFVFDTILVLLLILETYILNTLIRLLLPESLIVNTTVLRIIRLVRLTKMARMVRLLKWLQELVVLLKGLGIASKSVMFTLIMLMVIIYVFALVFRQLSSEYDCDTCIGTVYFKNVPHTCVTLLLQGTLPDLAEFVTAIADESFFLAVLLMVFIFLATITVMNMLTGILVEVVSTVSAIESETIMVNTVREKLHEMINDEFGENEEEHIVTRKISQAEFETLLVKPHFAQFVDGVGVDAVSLLESSDLIFREQELCFHEFVELILQLRGTNVATIKDLVDLRRFISNELTSKMAFLTSSQDGNRDEAEMEYGHQQTASQCLNLSLRAASSHNPRANIMGKRL